MMMMTMMMMTIESLCPARHRPYRILMEQANTILYCSECRVGVGHTAAFASARVAGAAAGVHGLANAAGRHIGHSCPGGGGVGRGASLGAPAEHMQLVHLSQP